ncbi:MAG: hypothetical protein EBU59_09860 [Planctomycetia bacterium]|nr:hypothetical protein [Planctomycetia bacterium]
MPIRSLSQQSDLFQRAASEASAALSKWLGRPSKITINNVSVLPITEAVGVLGVTDTPLAACAMQISGQYSGLLVLTSDDASGLALADMLLGREIGSSTEWSEVEQSAAVETANIIGCAYLNAMATDAENDDSAAPPLEPGGSRRQRFSFPHRLFRRWHAGQVFTLVHSTSGQSQLSQKPIHLSSPFIRPPT